MAPFLFAGAILNGQPIKIFNQGNMKRDFTYIDDIVEGIIRVADKIAEENSAYDPITADPATSNVPYRIFNIGNSDPVPLMEFIGSLESSIGRLAEKIYLPMQDGDVLETYANTSLLEEWIGFKPATKILSGVEKFINWFKWYYEKTN